MEPTQILASLRQMVADLDKGRYFDDKADVGEMHDWCGVIQSEVLRLQESLKEVYDSLPDED